MAMASLQQQARQPRIELTILAAEGLKNVSLMRGKMDPYAVAFVDPRAKHSTRILHKAGCDPVWNDAIAIPLLHLHSLLRDPTSSLTIQIFNHSSIGATALAGSTHLLLHDLLRHSAITKRFGEDGDVLTLQLFRPSGRPHGIVRVYLRISGDGLPYLHPDLFGEDLLVAEGFPFSSSSSSSMAPVTGIPVMATATSGSVGKYATATTKTVHPSFPLPTPPPRASARNHRNFLLGVLSGAVAAVLLGSFF